MKHIRTIVKRFWEYAFIILLSFPPIIWFSRGYVLLGHDSGFRIDYAAQVPNLFYSWDPKNNFGVDWSLFKGFLVTQFPETAGAALTHSFALGQMLALVFWFAVMGIGMLVFLRSVFPGVRYRFFRLFTSIFYMYNFFILNGWQIGERAKFSLWAALPVALLLVFNVFVRKQGMLKNGICFGLLYFFLNGGGVFPMYGGTAIIIITAFSVFSIARIRKDGTKGLWFSFRAIAAFVIPFLLLNAYYLIADIVLLKSSYTAVLGDHGGINGMIEWERVISKSASFINLIRLQGMPDWYDNPLHPYAKYFLTNKVLIVASFIPFVTAFAGFSYFRFKNASKEQRALLRLLIIVLPFALLFAMGTHPPTGILYEFAMKKIPGFVMFRSSFYKFAPAWWFPVIVLSGYYINEWIVRCTKNRKGYVFYGCLVIIGLLAYHFPYFTTGSFVLNDNFSTRLRIPAYVTDISAQIKRIVPENGRILILPALETNYINMPADTYTWGFFSLDILPRNVLGMRSVIANDSPDPVVQRLYAAIYKKDTAGMERLDAKLGIGYILWRGDVRLTDKTASDLPPEPVKEFLDTSKDVSAVVENGPWTLYQVTTAATPMITAPSQIDAYQGSEESGAYLIGATGDSKTGFITLTDPAATQTPYQQIYQTADCIMCQPFEYQKLVESIIIPHQRITPASPLFVFEKARQTQSIERTKTIPKERIDADIALAQNYASYTSESPDPRLLTAYDSYITDAAAQWQKLQGIDKNSYATRLRAYLESERAVVETFTALSNRDTVLGDIREISDELTRDLWMTDTAMYRYFITSPESGSFTVIVSTGAYATVDGTSYNSGSQIRISEGLHKIAVPKESGADIPFVFFVRKTAGDYSGAEVSFTKISPTAYTAHITHTGTSPFLLEFKQQYDPRWLLSGAAGEHVSVDGFANGWIINKQGTFDVTISYWPQQAFNEGLAITVAALALSGIVLIFIRIRRKHT